MFSGQNPPFLATVPRNFPKIAPSSPIGWLSSLHFTTILCPFGMFQTIGKLVLLRLRTSLSTTRLIKKSTNEMTPDDYSFDTKHIQVN